MGIFGSAKKKVSNREFQNNVRSQLASRGFDSQEINEVAMIFRADLDETSDLEKGIDIQELASGINWMRKHTNMHHLSTKEIDIVEEVLMKYI